MAVPFISRKRLNPQNLEAEGKFYPAPAYIAEIGVDKLAEDISQSTTLTPTEVIGVIRSLLLTVPKYMLLGYKVRLDSFGIFKLGLKNKASCWGYEKAGQVTANDIEGIRVMYTPDSMLKLKLEKPDYVKLDAKYISDDMSATGTDD
ncbi:MAG: DNA-binding protein [Treponema sp.]|nr:DNA-binding protein [Treponema sp.]